MVAVLDPESAAIITTALDTALSPRKGGPRFVDPEEQARSKRLENDPRTVQQLGVDVLVDIVQLATRAATSELDPEKIFGSNTPAVRVHVPLEALLTGQGAGWIEGQDASISADTAARHVCTSGILPRAGAKGEGDFSPSPRRQRRGPSRASDEPTPPASGSRSPPTGVGAPGMGAANPRR